MNIPFYRPSDIVKATHIVNTYLLRSPAGPGGYTTTHRTLHNYTQNATRRMLHNYTQNAIHGTPHNYTPDATHLMLHTERYTPYVAHMMLHTGRYKHAATHGSLHRLHTHTPHATHLRL